MRIPLISPAIALIDRFLYRRRFRSETVRVLLAQQLLLTGACFFLGLACIALTDWPLVFAAGSAIALFNFWHVARFVGANIQRQFSIGMAVWYFTMFLLRLGLTAVLLYLLVIWLRVSLVPLIAGLTSVIAGIFIWIATTVSATQVKEV